MMPTLVDKVSQQKLTNLRFPLSLFKIGTHWQPNILHEHKGHTQLMRPHRPNDQRTSQMIMQAGNDNLYSLALIQELRALRTKMALIQNKIDCIISDKENFSNEGPPQSHPHASNCQGHFIQARPWQNSIYTFSCSKLCGLKEAAFRGLEELEAKFNLERLRLIDVAKEYEAFTEKPKQFTARLRTKRMVELARRVQAPREPRCNGETKEKARQKLEYDPEESDVEVKGMRIKSSQAIGDLRKRDRKRLQKQRSVRKDWMQQVTLTPYDNLDGVMFLQEDAPGSQLEGSLEVKASPATEQKHPKNRESSEVRPKQLCITPASLVDSSMVTSAVVAVRQALNKVASICSRPSGIPLVQALEMLSQSVGGKWKKQLALIKRRFLVKVVQQSLHLDEGSVYRVSLLSLFSEAQHSMLSADDYIIRISQSKPQAFKVPLRTDYSKVVDAACKITTMARMLEAVKTRLESIAIQEDTEGCHSIRMEALDKEVANAVDQLILREASIVKPRRNQRQLGLVGSRAIPENGISLASGLAAQYRVLEGLTERVIGIAEADDVVKGTMGQLIEILPDGPSKQELLAQINPHLEPAICATLNLSSIREEFQKLQVYALYKSKGLREIIADSSVCATWQRRVRDLVRELA